MYKRKRSFAVVPYGNRRRSFKRTYTAGRGRGRTTLYRMYRAAPSAAFASQVRRVVSAERKYVHIQGTIIAQSQSAQSFPLSESSQGTGPTERIGNWIQPVSMHGTCTVTGDPTGPSDSVTKVRVFIWIINDNASAFVVDPYEFMDDRARPHGPFNINRKGGFSVVWTRVCTVADLLRNDKHSMTYSWSLSLNKKQKCLFSGPADFNRTKFHYNFAALSDVPNPLSNPPTIVFDSMFRYTDS